MKLTYSVMILVVTFSSHMLIAEEEYLIWSTIHQKYITKDGRIADPQPEWKRKQSLSSDQKIHVTPTLREETGIEEALHKEKFIRAQYGNGIVMPPGVALWSFFSFLHHVEDIEFKISMVTESTGLEGAEAHTFLDWANAQYTKLLTEQAEELRVFCTSDQSSSPKAVLQSLNSIDDKEFASYARLVNTDLQQYLAPQTKDRLMGYLANEWSQSGGVIVTDYVKQFEQSSSSEIRTAKASFCKRNAPGEKK